MYPTTKNSIEKQWSMTVSRVSEQWLITNDASGVKQFRNVSTPSKWLFGIQIKKCKILTSDIATSEIQGIHALRIDGWLLWLWLWLWFCTAVYEPKPSLEIVHWPSSIPVSTSGVSSGKVVPMKDFHHGCKYSTGEDLTLLGARDAMQLPV